MLHAACSKVDITAYEKGGDVMGWGLHHCRLRGVAGKLYARAFAFQGQTPEGKSKTHVIISCDLWAITQSLTDAVGQNLAQSKYALSEHDFVICATHTHSGPGGYQHDLLYTLNNHGISAHVFDTITQGITEAALKALDSLEPARVFVHQGDFSDDDKVAFNRSLHAYNKNKDVDLLPKHLAHLATSRTMTTLNIRAENQKPLGLIAWFASHATSLHSDIALLHGDHKGSAAQKTEAAFQKENPNFVAGFPQGAAGDVSPNFRWDKKRKMTIGLSDDDFESCAYVGQKQSDLAVRLFAEAPQKGRLLQGDLDSATLYTNFDGLAVSADHGGGKVRYTGASRYGLGLAAGTPEGPGPLLKVRFLVEALTLFQKFSKGIVGKSNDAYGPMVPLLESGRGIAGKAFGLLPLSRIPAAIDPSFIDVVRLQKEGQLDGVPWVQNCVPIHLFRLGDFALCTLPNEPTTIAAKRIARVVQDAFAGQVSTTVVAGYAQSYSGYLTTHEEYQVQAYEGSTTLFGQWSLGAYEMRFTELCSQLQKPIAKRAFSEERPYRLSDAEIEARAYRLVDHPHVQKALTRFIEPDA